MMRPVNHSSYLEGLLNSGQGTAPEVGSGWLRTLRMRAVERANELAVPTTRDEEWRFTDLSPLYKTVFAAAEHPGSAQKAQIDALAIPEADTQLVFIDGKYSASLSDAPNQVGFSVANLAGIGGSTQTVAASHLSTLALIDKDPFSAVNTAFLQDAAVIHVKRDHVLSAPIHLLFITVQNDRANYPRVLVVTEPGAQCTIVEDYVGITGGPYLTDSVSEIFVAEDSRVAHVKLQREAQSAFHIANTSVKVAQRGHYSTWNIALGARISRQNLSIIQAGEATEFALDGLAVIAGRQVADMHSSIDHACAHGRSRQVHKTVVGGGAHAVFNGKILVRRTAQQTDSGQQSRNLLTSGMAHVDTKPQLEIFADDVKCAHGATVGQIEADELFYLKSRGLSDTVARNLLTYAFAAEIIERIPVKSLVERLEQSILEQTQTRQ